MAKTVINDKQLYEKRNRDDIFVRDVIGGLLKVLNNKLVYPQVWSGEGGQYFEEDVTIPFYYELGNVTSERFLQDNYVTFGSQCGFKQISGNFDMIPRGMISLDAMQIESDSATNRMVMGEYQREDYNDGGKIKSYVAMLYALPITMDFSCEIRSSSFSEMLKITQACNEFFFKNKTYYITHKGMKLGCRVGFPDSFLGEKNSGFTMGGSDAVDKTNLKQTFSLKVECYQPVFDKTTEQLKSNVVRQWGSSLDIFNSQREIEERNGKVTVTNIAYDDLYFFQAPYFYDKTYNVPSEEYENEFLIPNGLDYTSGILKDAVTNDNSMYLVDDYENTLFPSNSVIPIRWNYNKSKGDINYVNIMWDDYIDGKYKDENFLVEDVSTTAMETRKNNLFYDFVIPKSFTDFDGTDIIIYNDDAVKVKTEPTIRIVPDPETKEITEKSIFCLDGGYFFCNHANEQWDKKEKNTNGSFSYYTHINAEIAYKDGKGGYKQYSIILPIKDNKIETCGKNNIYINFERVMKPIKILYKDEIPFRKGRLRICDTKNPKRRVTLEMTIV